MMNQEDRQRSDSPAEESGALSDGASDKNAESESAGALSQAAAFAKLAVESLRAELNLPETSDSDGQTDDEGRSDDD